LATDAQEAEAPSKATLVDYRFRGRELRGVWSLKKHADGTLTVVAVHWPRSNQNFVESDNFAAILTSDTKGPHLACYEGANLVERLYIATDSKSPFGLQVTSSATGTSTALIKDSEIEWKGPLLLFNKEIERQHSLLAELIKRSRALNNPIVHAVDRAYSKTMSDSARGWIRAAEPE